MNRNPLCIEMAAFIVHWVTFEWTGVYDLFVCLVLNDASILVGN